MENSRKQVLFLVDVGFLGQIEQQQLRKQHTRAVCLACCRILLHLSRFPAKDALGKVKWSYYLHSNVRGIALQSKVHPFQDVRSELLENFYKDLEERVGEEARPEAGSFPTPANRAATAASLIYTSLASVVQDCLWEAPELSSPVRPRASSKPRGGRQRGRNKREEVFDKEKTVSSSHSNLIFLFSWLPRSQAEVEVFCHQDEMKQHKAVEVRLREQLLPTPLITQLINKDIALHWVESRIDWQREGKEVCVLNLL